MNKGVNFSYDIFSMIQVDNLEIFVSGEYNIAGGENFVKILKF